ANFANAMSSITSNSSSNAQINTNDQSVKCNNVLFISPNPVINQFYVELKNHSIINDIEIYNQSAQLVLHEKVSGTRVYIQKNEISNTSGIYYIKVTSGNKSYAGKLMLL